MLFRSVVHWGGESWKKRKLPRIQGGGEIRFGRRADSAERWIATIEPLHGDKLVVYAIRDSSTAADVADRVVLASDFVQGHAIAVADLVGQGRPQIVAGWRNKNASGDTGIRLYWLGDEGTWHNQWIDQGGMATEDLRVADLNGDGRPDIVAAGRATKNLKVYWNEGPVK